MKTNFNRRQKSLIKKCEKFHESGINHTGLSGSLTEDLLITFLTQDIDDFKFYKGHISKEVGEVTTYSSQIDVIITDKTFKQSKVFKVFPNYINVVPVEHVRGVIEVKKWTNPKMLLKNGTLQNAKNNFIKFDSDIPYLLVTFRFHDRVRDDKFFSDFNKTDIDSYCLYGRNVRKGGQIQYPWHEVNWDDFEKSCHYQGEYERLVKTIKTLNK